MSAYRFHLTGPVIPKARPRFTGMGGAHLPENYRIWKEGAIAQFLAQKPPKFSPLGGVSLSMRFVGKHSRRGDLSNAFGAIEDALVQAGILKDDNMKQVTAIAAEIEHGKQPPYAEIHIQEQK